MITKEQYDKLNPYTLAINMYVDTNINVGINMRALAEVYKTIDPNERIDLWCSGCTDILIRRCYDLIKEYNGSST